MGTGRCGTHCLAQLMSLERVIASTHERHPFNDTFHRYCKWYGLPVDAGGFIQTKAINIEKDLEHHAFSFEASAYLSLSIVELYQFFGAKFLILARSPEKVVNSYIRKGWYQQPYSRYNSHHIPSYQPGMKTHHFLGRIIPSGSIFDQWQQMTQVGKLAWYWNTLNSKIVEQLKNI
ncbi:hypothetical protein [Leptolyngbya ectocarpi]|nr:hypothetical protein [Leptolyngbya ectocarpi]